MIDRSRLSPPRFYGDRFRKGAVSSRVLSSQRSTRHNAWRSAPLALVAVVGIVSCHHSVASDCEDLDALALMCPGAPTIAPSDQVKFCTEFAAASAAGHCDDKNTAAFSCVLLEPNVCDSNAINADCATPQRAADACMKAYCENHKNDPGCANVAT